MNIEEYMCKIRKEGKKKELPRNFNRGPKGWNHETM